MNYPYHRYALEHVKPETFFEIPEHFRSEHGGGLERYATYERFAKDTLQHNGCMAACTLSMAFKPKVVVEFGVKFGWTSWLLCKFNPEARVYGVDNVGPVHDSILPTGYVPFMHNCKNYSLSIMNSWEFSMPGQVDLCFVDADHFMPNVLKDCRTAWRNRNTSRDWCIAFDDYHPSNPDVVEGIDTLTKETGMELQKIGSWHWIGTKSYTEEELRGIQ